MPFSSQTEAKQFLLEKIALQAQRQGEVLSDVEKRLLLYSVDEPESAEGIPEEALVDVDFDWEARMRRLFESAYNEADQEERNRIADAIRQVNKGDHYIAVIARQ